MLPKGKESAEEIVSAVSRLSPSQDSERLHQAKKAFTFVTHDLRMKVTHNVPPGHCLKAQIGWPEGLSPVSTLHIPSLLYHSLSFSNYTKRFRLLTFL